MFSFTKEDLENLKQDLRRELKQEIIEEIASKSISSTSNWTKVKKSIEPRLKKLEPIHLNRIETALATLARYTFDVRTVTVIQDKDLVEAKNFTSEVLDLMFRYSVNGLNYSK